MWNGRHSQVEGARRFFGITIAKGELHDHYKTNFLLMNEHNFSLTEMDNMFPYEREIYVMLLLAHMKKKPNGE